MKGSDLLKKILEEMGVKYVFGILGRESEFITFDKDDKLKFILVHHEQSSAIMAEAYARITGKPQVCFSTMGPGLTNMLTGIASAYKEKSPLLAISAQCEKGLNHNCTHQYLNNVQLAQPVVKYAAQIEKVEDLPREIAKCYKIMMTPPFGPCFLSIPVDVFDQEFSEFYENNFSLIIEKEINELKLEKLYQKILNSHQPLIISGYESLNIETSRLVRIFSEKYNIPIATTLAGKGAMPENHHLSLGAITKYYDLFFKTSLNKELFEKVDLVVFLGVDWGEDFPKSFLRKNSSQTICRINSYNDGVENVFPLDIDIFEGSINDSLMYLINKKANPKNISFEIDKIKEQKKKIFAGKKNNELDPFAIINTMRESLEEDHVMVVDVGMHKHIAGLGFEVISSLTYFGSNNLATMGFSIPAAMGIKLAKPEKRVIALCGDGGLYSIIGELETCIRNNLNIILIVFKDNSFGLIKHYNLLGFNKYSDTIVSFNDIDISVIASGFGLNSKNVKSNSEFKKYFNEALEANVSTLICVPVSYEKLIDSDNTDLL